MKTSWQVWILATVILASLVLEACCRPQQLINQRDRRQAAEERQFIGGLSTLGALVQPILFMIGMANFMGRIPTFFNRMRDRFSSTLAGTGAPAGAGRRKRAIQESSLDDDAFERAIRALKMLAEAESKYNTQS